MTRAGLYFGEYRRKHLPKAVFFLFLVLGSHFEGVAGAVEQSVHRRQRRRHNTDELSARGGVADYESFEMQSHNGFKANTKHYGQVNTKHHGHGKKIEGSRNLAHIRRRTVQALPEEFEEENDDDGTEGKGGAESSRVEKSDVTKHDAERSGAGGSVLVDLKPFFSDLMGQSKAREGNLKLAQITGNKDQVDKEERGEVSPASLAAAIAGDCDDYANSAAKLSMEFSNVIMDVNVPERMKKCQNRMAKSLTCVSETFAKVIEVKGGDQAVKTVEKMRNLQKEKCPNPNEFNKFGATSYKTALLYAVDEAQSSKLGEFQHVGVDRVKGLTVSFGGPTQHLIKEALGGEAAAAANVIETILDAINDPKKFVNNVVPILTGSIGCSSVDRPTMRWLFPELDAQTCSEILEPALEVIRRTSSIEMASSEVKVGCGARMFFDDVSRAWTDLKLPACDDEAQTHKTCIPVKVMKVVQRVKTFSDIFETLRLEILNHLQATLGFERETAMILLDVVSSGEITVEQIRTILDDNKFDLPELRYLEDIFRILHAPDCDSWLKRKADVCGRPGNNAAPLTLAAGAYSKLKESIDQIQQLYDECSNDVAADVTEAASEAVAAVKGDADTTVGKTVSDDDACAELEGKLKGFLQDHCLSDEALPVQVDLLWGRGRRKKALQTYVTYWREGWEQVEFFADLLHRFTSTGAIAGDPRRFQGDVVLNAKETGVAILKRIVKKLGSKLMSDGVGDILSWTDFKGHFEQVESTLNTEATMQSKAISKAFSLTRQVVSGDVSAQQLIDDHVSAVGAAVTQAAEDAGAELMGNLDDATEGLGSEVVEVYDLLKGLGENKQKPIRSRDDIYMSRIMRIFEMMLIFTFLVYFIGGRLKKFKAVDFQALNVTGVANKATNDIMKFILPVHLQMLVEEHASSNSSNTSSTDDSPLDALKNLGMVDGGLTFAERVVIAFLTYFILIRHFIEKFLKYQISGDAISLKKPKGESVHERPFYGRMQFMVMIPLFFLLVGMIFRAKSVFEGKVYEAARTIHAVLGVLSIFRYAFKMIQSTYGLKPSVKLAEDLAKYDKLHGGVESIRAPWMTPEYLTIIFSKFLGRRHMSGMATDSQLFAKVEEFLTSDKHQVCTQDEVFAILRKMLEEDKNALIAQTFVVHMTETMLCEEHKMKEDDEAAVELVEFMEDLFLRLETLYLGLRATQMAIDTNDQTQSQLVEVSAGSTNDDSAGRLSMTQNQYGNAGPEAARSPLFSIIDHEEQKIREQTEEMKALRQQQSDEMRTLRQEVAELKSMLAGNAKSAGNAKLLYNHLRN